MHHTLEPWNVSPTPLGNIRIADSSENTIALITSGAGKRKRGANAKRIVACVNACAGIEDPEATLKDVVSSIKILKVARERELAFRYNIGVAMELSILSEALQRLTPNP